MQEKFKKSTIKTFIMSLAIAGLELGMALPVSADTLTPPTLHTVQGKVTSVTQSTFTVQNGNQTAVTITTDGNTTFYLIPVGKVIASVDNKVAADTKEDKSKGLPTPSRPATLKELHIPANWRDNLGWLETFDQKAKFSDIQTGDKVIVRSTTDTNVAKQVIIIKAPVIQQVKGTITLSGNSIIVAPTNGSAPANLTWTGDTRFSIKGSPAVQTGQSAVVTYNKNTMVAQLVNVEAASPTTTPKS